MCDTICSNVISGVDTAEVDLGQNMKMTLNFNKQTNAQNDITYLVRNVLHLYLCVSCVCFVLHTTCLLYACILDKCWCVKLFAQILSRGQLVKHGRFKTERQVLIALIVPITKEMLPSFRIIAYYHTSGNEVVSDSVWVDVKDTCMGTVRHNTKVVKLMRWKKNKLCDIFL